MQDGTLKPEPCVEAPENSSVEPQGAHGTVRTVIKGFMVVAQDNKIVLSVTGLDGWKDKMLPKIAALTGTTI